MNLLNLEPHYFKNLGPEWSKSLITLKCFNNFIKSLINFHKPSGKKDVFIISTPRSGSTWVMELIAAQPGFKYCDEPFDLRDPFNASKLGIFQWGELYDDNSYHKIKKYLSCFTEGKFISGFKNPSPLTVFYKPFTNRIVFKIIHACEDKILWIKENFNCNIIFLVRHPIPVAISHKTHPKLRTFISSKYKDFFNKKQIKFAKNIVNNGSFFEQGVLDWCFQNYMPLNQKSKDIIIITYEQLVIDPVPLITVLANELELPKPDRIIKRLSLPSRSTSQSDEKTRKQIIKKNKDLNSFLIEKWKSKISNEQEKKLMSILEIFAIDIYKFNSIMPLKKYWID